MDESNATFIVIGILGLSLLFVIYRYFSHHRQLKSGTEIGHFYPERQDRSYYFENILSLSTGGKWCRLLLRLRSSDKFQMSYSPKYFFEKIAFVVGTPYSLALKDIQGRVLHNEKGSLGSFVSLLGGKDSSTGTIFRESGNGHQEGTFTFLEFLPEKAGHYTISLRIGTQAQAAAMGSSSEWELLDIELIAMENVIPMSKIAKYPHQRIKL